MKYVASMNDGVGFVDGAVVVDERSESLYDVEHEKWGCEDDSFDDPDGMMEMNADALAKCNESKSEQMPDNNFG